MLRFIARRLAWMVVVLFGVVTLAFLLMRLIPGSPWDRPTARRMLQNITTNRPIQIDPVAERELDRQFGLDQPVWQQYTAYLFGRVDKQGQFVCGLVCGNLGPSYRQRGRTVQSILFDIPEGKTSAWDSRVGYSIRLAAFAFIIAAGFGLPIGILAAVRRNSRFDHISGLLMAVSASIPNFVVGLVLLITLASGLKLIAVIPNWTEPKAWITPAVVLAVAPMGTLARITRGSMLEAMHRDYVRTARAKGLTERAVITVHILKNALIPIVTTMGPALIELIAGSFVIEGLFGFPGFGREYWEAIENLDYSMVTGVTLLYGMLIALANLFIDVLYGLLDPRIRLE